MLQELIKQISTNNYYKDGKDLYLKSYCTLINKIITKLCNESETDITIFKTHFNIIINGLENSKDLWEDINENIGRDIRDKIYCMNNIKIIYEQKKLLDIFQ